MRHLTAMCLLGCDPDAGSEAFEPRSSELSAPIFARVGGGGDVAMEEVALSVEVFETLADRGELPEGLATLEPGDQGLELTAGDSVVAIGLILPAPASRKPATPTSSTTT